MGEPLKDKELYGVDFGGTIFLIKARCEEYKFYLKKEQDIKSAVEFMREGIRDDRHDLVKWIMQFLKENNIELSNTQSDDLATILSDFGVNQNKSIDVSFPDLQDVTNKGR